MPLIIKLLIILNSFFAEIFDLEKKLANSARLISNPNQNAQHRLLTGCRPPVFDL